MVKQVINVGSSANDHTGDGLHDGLVKANSNFTEVYGAVGYPVYTATGSHFWLPISHSTAGGAGVAVGTGSIRLAPGYIGATITLSNLTARVTTLSAAGNFQMAVYAASSSTGYPTGNSLVSTASISTSATGTLSSAASVQLTPGLYWWALNADNATVAFPSYGIGSLTTMQLIGGLGTANIFTSIPGLFVAQTFGTWPDLTATSWSSANEATNLSIPMVGFQIASVP